jgi:hypothetical protein
MPKKKYSGSDRASTESRKVQANFRLPPDLLELLDEATEGTPASQADLIEMCVSLYLDPAIQRLEDDAAQRRLAARERIRAKFGKNHEALLDRAMKLILKAKGVSSPKTKIPIIEDLGGKDALGY